MSDLGGNPEDQFSHVTAQILFPSPLYKLVCILKFCILRMRILVSNICTNKCHMIGGFFSVSFEVDLK